MKVGIIGWRGMVGSVLLERMRAEEDFEGLATTFFSTSNPGGPGPDVGSGAQPLLDAGDLRALAAADVLISCQGGDYTRAVYPGLREAGWDGYWIDAASALRMHDDAVLVLDPVNGDAIQQAIGAGKKTFVGANCTVSLMLMAVAGLLQNEHVDWISSMTYQAASGAGAQNLRELVSQMRVIGERAADILDDPKSAILTLDQNVRDTLRADVLPTSAFGAPLAMNALPFIDRPVEEGQSREEYKGMAEANKLLGTQAQPIPVDGTCVRIGSMRCHAQALTIKLKKSISPQAASDMIANAHPFVKVVDNTPDETLRALTPAAVAGSLEVRVGRIRSMKLGPDYLSAFTVGDQLLWGAAEPLRRMLKLLRSS